MKIVAATFVLAGALLAAALGDLGKAQGRAVVLDVGQGDAIYVRTPDGQDLLIDSGPKNGRVVEQLRAQLPRGDNQIEMVISTHFDADHSGGMVDVLNAFEVLRVVTNGVAPTTKTGREFLETVSAKNAELLTLARGQQLKGRGWLADIIWPASDYQTSDTNAASLVLRLLTAKQCLLLTGDLPDAAEKELLNRATPLSCQALKVGHHGSKTSSTTSFLNAVNPSRALISVGAKNQYGHPTQEALGRLEASGATIHRTDQEGSISVPL